MSVSRYKKCVKLEPASFMAASSRKTRPTGILIPIGKLILPITSKITDCAPRRLEIPALFENKLKMMMTFSRSSNPAAFHLYPLIPLRLAFST